MFFCGFSNHSSFHALFRMLCFAFMTILGFFHAGFLSRCPSALHIRLSYMLSFPPFYISGAFPTYHIIGSRCFRR